MSTDFADYPAAHSMDTTWWAVDAEGQVAKFDSGEAGAVPADLREGGYQSDLLEQLEAAGFKGVRFFADDLFAEADGKLLFRDWQTPWNEVAKVALSAAGESRNWCFGYLLWLRDEPALRSLEAALAPAAPAKKSLVQRLTSVMTSDSPASASRYKVVRLPVQDKIVVWVCGAGDSSGCVPLATMEGLARERHVLRGWMYGEDLEVERFGFFGYEHDRFGRAGPYQQTAAPPHPVRVADLPADVAEGLGACRLEGIDFRREPLLQPFDLGEAYCWGDEWISATGRLRRTDDREATPYSSSKQYPIAPGNWRSELAPLVAVYLREEAGADDVLNDYLEESGQPPLAAEPGTVRRLEAVVVRFLSPEELLTWEAESLEHWFQAEASTPPTAGAIRTAIDASKDVAAGSSDAAALEEAASEAFRQWSRANEESQSGTENRMAWAAWALASRLPLVATRTAREVRPQELAWQIEHALARLDQKFCGVS